MLFEISRAIQLMQQHQPSIKNLESFELCNTDEVFAFKLTPNLSNAEKWFKETLNFLRCEFFLVVNCHNFYVRFLEKNRLIRNLT